MKSFTITMTRNTVLVMSFQWWYAVVNDMLEIVSSMRDTFTFCFVGILYNDTHFLDFLLSLLH